MIKVENGIDDDDREMTQPDYRGPETTLRTWDFTLSKLGSIGGGGVESKILLRLLYRE